MICPIAPCKGKFYFNCTATELRVIDFNNPEPVLSTITVDDTIGTDGSYGYDESRPGIIFLVESEGDLYMVRLLYASSYLDDEQGKIIDKATVHRMDFRLHR